MPTVDEPTIWDRVIYRGTDHEWLLRRVNEEAEPIIPDSAKAQIRESFGGKLWVECGIDIDTSEGWVTISIPEADTESADWGSRKQGVWDIEVIIDGSKYRWAMGAVKVSQDVTR